MSTWHQRQAGNGLLPMDSGGDSWTVWSNPPESMSCSMSGFQTRADAEAYIDRCEGFRPGSREFNHIIPPATDSA